MRPSTYRPQPAAVVRPGKKPAGYSLDLEVLATIPLTTGAPVSTLAADFRIDRSAMMLVLGRLARYGVQVVG